MERSNKKFILIIMIIGIFLLTGCNKFRFNTFNASDEKKNGSQITQVPEKIEQKNELEASIKGVEEVISTESVTTTPSVIQPIATSDLLVYTVNIDTGEIQTVTALIPKGSELSPKLIVDKVVESMADQSINVEIENIQTKDKAVIVSFFKDKAPLAEVGSSYETAILNAIAQSLIDNLDDYTEVIYRVEGKAYISGHIELGIDEVYLSDN